MPRVIVTTDEAELARRSVLFDEYVYSVHLSTDHSATQLLERLGWAVSEAESVVRAADAHKQPSASGSPPRASAHRPAERH
jgi:hypothetical protein